LYFPYITQLVKTPQWQYRKEVILERVAKIRKFVVDNFLFGDETKLPSEDTSFLNNGIIDSTGMLEVINFIEEVFAIKVEDNELLPENLDSLRNIDKYIGSKLGQ